MEGDTFSDQGDIKRETCLYSLSTCAFGRQNHPLRVGENAGIFRLSGDSMSVTSWDVEDGGDPLRVDWWMGLVADQSNWWERGETVKGVPWAL